MLFDDYFNILIQFRIYMCSGLCFINYDVQCKD